MWSSHTILVASWHLRSRSKASLKIKVSLNGVRSFLRFCMNLVISIGRHFCVNHVISTGCQILKSVSNIQRFLLLSFNCSQVLHFRAPLVRWIYWQALKFYLPSLTSDFDHRKQRFNIPCRFQHSVAYWNDMTHALVHYFSPHMNKYPIFSKLRCLSKICLVWPLICRKSHAITPIWFDSIETNFTENSIQ